MAKERKKQAESWMRKKCPACGAPGGVYCRDDGKLRLRPHPARNPSTAETPAGKADTTKASTEAPAATGLAGRIKAVKARKKKPAQRSVWTVSGGGFESNRKRH